MKKTLMTLGIFVVVIFGILLFLRFNKTMSVAEDVKPNTIAMCYAYTQPSALGDRAILKMNIAGENVTGEYKNLPAQKDSKVGTFVGTVGEFDKIKMTRTANVWWDSLAEGMKVKEELDIEFGDSRAFALFGEMVDRGDGVYVYKDKTNLTPGFNMSQVDCESLVELNTK